MRQEKLDKVSLILFNLYLYDAIRQWNLGQGTHLTQDRILLLLLFSDDQVSLVGSENELQFSL